MFKRLLSALVFAAVFLFGAAAHAALVGVGTQSFSASATSTTPAYPSNVATGMVVFALVTANTSINIINPSGWQAVNVQTDAHPHRNGLYVHCYTSGDSAPTFTIGSAQNIGSITWAYTDVNCSHPIDKSEYTSVSSGSISLAALTPTNSNEDAFAAIAGFNLVSGPNQPWTLTSASSSNFTYDLAFEMTAGSAATDVLTGSGGGNPTAGFEVLLNPATSLTSGDIRGTTSNSSGSGVTSFTVSVPPTQSGDAVMAVVGEVGTAAVTSTGFSAVRTTSWSGCCFSGSLITLCRTATNAEGSSYTFNIGASNQYIATVTAVARSQCPPDISAGTSTTSLSTSYSSPTVTTTGANEIVFDLFAGFSNQITAPTILLQRGFIANISQNVSYHLQPAAGLSTAQTATASSQEWQSQTVAMTTVSATGPSYTLPTMTAATNCDTGAGATSLTCTAPSGSTGDLLLAGLFLRQDPGSSALSPPSGFSLLKYQNDATLGLVGPAKPDTAVTFLGATEHQVITTATVSSSGTSAYTIRGCFQFPIGWYAGGGIIAVDANQNGTSDTTDKGLRMNPSGQVTFATGSTTTLFGSATVLTSPLSYNDGKWHCAYGVYDGTNATLYVDSGTAVAGPTAAAGNTIPATGYWVIGYVKQPGFNYSGPDNLGQLAVFPSALSGATITSELSHLTDGTFAAVTIADGASHYWKLGESTPDTAADSAGTDTGIYNNWEGQVNQVSVGGMGDKAPRFGGRFLSALASHVTGLTQLVNPLASAFSEVAFIQVPTGFQGGGAILMTNTAQDGSGTGSNFNQVLYVDSSNHLRCGVRTSIGITTAAEAGTINDGTTHLVSCTWSAASNTVTLYIDGSSVGTGTSSGTLTACTCYWVIGTGAIDSNWPGWPGSPNNGSGGPNAGSLRGIIGRVAIFGAVLSGAQESSLAAHVNDGTYDTVLTGLSPTSYWKLNETTPGTVSAVDSAGTNTGQYFIFLGKAFAVYAKTRTGSEPASYSFGLGSSMLAAGAVLDINGANNVIDGSSIWANGATAVSFAAGTAYALPNSVADTGAIAIGLLGWDTNAANGSYYPWAQAASDIDASGVGLFAGTLDYTTSDQSGYLTLQSAPVNTLGMELVLPAGTPTPPTGGGGFVYLMP